MDAKMAEWQSPPRLAAMRAEHGDSGDGELRRYLRARKGVVRKASDMLSATKTWRRTFGRDALVAGGKAAVIAAENATGKVYCRGHDLLGRPILYLKPRFENTKDHDGNLAHLVYQLERAIACMPEGVEKIALVIDYAGFSLLNAPPLKTSIATLSILQNHYPERLGVAFLVDPPALWEWCWRGISPFIDPVTREKIQWVRGESRRAEAWTGVIDLEVLEASVGGRDARPFDSARYLAAPMSQDYATVLAVAEGAVAVEEKTCAADVMACLGSGAAADAAVALDEQTG
jgi:hypothetical protein